MNKCVLIITTHYPPNIGGVESHLQALVSQLIKRHWSVLISTYQPLASFQKAPLVEKEGSVRIYRMPWVSFNIFHELARYPILEFIFLFPGLMLMSFFVLVNNLKEIEVIHCQGLVSTVVGLIIGKVFRKRIISSIHNLYFFPKKGLYPQFSKIVFSAVDTVLVPSRTSKKELERIKVSSKKIKIFRYWINLKIFRSVDRRKAKTKLGWKKFTVFFVGRLIETKGVLLLLDAFKNINSDVSLIIAGSGPLAQNVKKVAAKISNLQFLGRVENTNLPLHYSAADLVVVPSTVDEGFGFVVMEATACGTPVLASNRGGLEDAVSPSVGKLVEPTVENFKKEIERLSGSHTEMNRFAKNCRAYAVENFSDKNILDIITAYDSNN